MVARKHASKELTMDVWSGSTSATSCSSSSGMAKRNRAVVHVKRAPEMDQTMVACPSSGYRALSLPRHTPRLAVQPWTRRACFALVTIANAWNARPTLRVHGELRLLQKLSSARKRLDAHRMHGASFFRERSYELY